MIIVKNRGTEIISMVRNTKTETNTFSIALQNTTTKEITVFTTEDMGNQLYMKFKLNLSNMEDGEYYVLVFENPDEIPFYLSNNNPSEVCYFKYIANDDNLITNGKYYLVMTDKNTETEVTYIQSELMRIGEYIPTNTCYRKEETYYTYQG